MPFTPKVWQDEPATTTPIDAAALVDLETRLSGYTDAEKNRAMVAEQLLAPLASPALSGIPSAPTAAALTNNAQIASTGYADAAVAVEKARALAAEALLAPLVENVEVVSSSGAAHTLTDVTTNTMHLVTLTAACTLTFPTAVAGKSFFLALVQDGTGGRTVTWPASIVKWAGAAVPTLTVTNGKTDIFSFVCADGINWFGFVAGLDF